MFWREIAANPEKVFGPDRADNTAWNLWRAMEQAGDEVAHPAGIAALSSSNSAEKSPIGCAQLSR
jgi:hypothetical protein